MAFWHRHRHISSKGVFTWLMGISVLCLFLPHSITERFDDVFSVLVAPFSSPVRDASLAVASRLGQGRSGGLSPQDIEQQYLADQNRLINLRQRLYEQEELIVELSGLRQRFWMARTNLISAQIVGTDSRGHVHNLNVGSVDHVRKGQLVLARVGGDCSDAVGDGKQPCAVDMCVVGRIKDTGMLTSTLELVSAPGFTLPVFVEPPGSMELTWQARGFLNGNSLGPMTVTMVKHQYPVEVGSVVVTRVESKLLPTDMIMGVVFECKPDDKNPVMWDITVVPAANLNSLREVIVVGALNEQ